MEYTLFLFFYSKCTTNFEYKNKFKYANIIMASIVILIFAKCCIDNEKKYKEQTNKGPWNEYDIFISTDLFQNYLSKIESNVFN